MPSLSQTSTGSDRKDKKRRGHHHHRHQHQHQHQHHSHHNHQDKKGREARHSRRGNECEEGEVERVGGSAKYSDDETQVQAGRHVVPSHGRDEHGAVVMMSPGHSSPRAGGGGFGSEAGPEAKSRTALSAADFSSPPAFLSFSSPSPEAARARNQQRPR